MTDEQPSARELAALYWTAVTGRTASAAVVMGVKQLTIAAHLREVRSKLRAKSTAQAFVFAVRRGLIDPHNGVVATQN